MFHAVNLDALRRLKPLHDSMFLDRASQFIERHNWPLRLSSAGFEVDDFDDSRTTYCIAEHDGRHQASLRLRSTDDVCMVERHFSELWKRSGNRLRGGVEVTRFCAAPLLSPDERLTAVSDLLLGLCRHCQKSGAPTFFGVVFPSVARVIRQLGWTPLILDRMQDASGTLLLCEWTASEMVAWNVQECREMREQSWYDRRAAACLCSERTFADQIAA
jgi:N-acyl-L-homoserine lactone synthetase